MISTVRSAASPAQSGPMPSRSSQAPSAPFATMLGDDRSAETPDWASRDDRPLPGQAVMADANAARPSRTKPVEQGSSDKASKQPQRNAPTETDGADLRPKSAADKGKATSAGEKPRAVRSEASSVDNAAGDAGPSLPNSAASGMEAAAFGALHPACSSGKEAGANEETSSAGDGAQVGPSDAAIALTAALVAWQPPQAHPPGKAAESEGQPGFSASEQAAEGVSDLASAKTLIPEGVGSRLGGPQSSQLQGTKPHAAQVNGSGPDAGFPVAASTAVAGKSQGVDGVSNQVSDPNALQAKSPTGSAISPDRVLSNSALPSDAGAAKLSSRPSGPSRASPGQNTAATVGKSSPAGGPRLNGDLSSVQVGASVQVAANDRTPGLATSTLVFDVDALAAASGFSHEAEAESLDELTATPSLPDAGPSPAFPPTAISSVAGPGAAQATAGATPAPISVPLHQLAPTLTRAAKTGVSQVDIALAPAELGRINISLQFDGMGGATARFTAERPETLTLLSQDQGTLAQALRDAGLDSSSTSLSFDLSSGSSGQFAGDLQQDRPRFASRAERAGLAGSDDVGLDDEENTAASLRPASSMLRMYDLSV